MDGSIKVFLRGRGRRIQPTHVIRLPEAKAPLTQAGDPQWPGGCRTTTLVFMLRQPFQQAPGVQHRRRFAAPLLWDVGVAPYDVVLANGKAFVSNWGATARFGRLDRTSRTGNGSSRVDPVRHIASEGSVSLIDLAGNRVSKELVTGLHASALAVSPNRKFVVCANAGSDHLSLIDVAAETVVETVWVKSKPSDLFGASPNALAFDDSGRRLFVANGTQNAVAVLHFDPEEKGTRSSKA